MKRMSVNDCFICKKSVPQSFSDSSPNRIQPKRLVKSRKNVIAPSVEWIKCDICKHWFHTQCCGLNSTDFKKLTSAKQFFKCLICCLKTLPSNCRTELLHSANGETYSTSVTPVTRNTSIDSSEFDQHQSLSGGICSTIHSDLVCESVKNETLPQNLTEKVLEPVVLDLESRVTEKKDIVFDAESDIDKILIVDNINNPVEFSSSRRILKEIHNYFPLLKVNFAYSLARGGVAVHVTCKSDRDLLIDSLPKESFGGGVKHPPKGNCESTFFIKGVDTSADVCILNDFFSNEEIHITEIRRLTKRHTGKPTQVVKVKCKLQSSEKLLNTKLVVNNKACVVEKERKVRVYRCYNCQNFGHIARNCKEDTRCEFCAKAHIPSQSCFGNVLCCNCGGPHTSAHSRCPAYLARHETLTVQCAEC